MVPLVAASCGGSTPPKASRASHTVSGPGFTFTVPAGWAVTRTGTAIVVRRPNEENGPLVSATAYRLTKAYSPGLFAQAAKELDGVVAKIVQASKGTLIQSVTTTVDGQRIRAYRFTSHPSGRPSTDDRIGFVLEGRHEYQLLCRAPAGAGDPDSACALLFGSFAARLK